GSRGRARRCAIMCAETLWWRCHRRIIADYLVSAGETVFHILGAANVARAHLTPAAPPGPGGTPAHPGRAPPPPARPPWRLPPPRRPPPRGPRAPSSTPAARTLAWNRRGG